MKYFNCLITNDPYREDFKNPESIQYLSGFCLSQATNFYGNLFGMVGQKILENFELHSELVCFNFLGLRNCTVAKGEFLVFNNLNRLFSVND